MLWWFRALIALPDPITSIRGKRRVFVATPRWRYTINQPLLPASRCVVELNGQNACSTPMPPPRAAHSLVKVDVR
uniref:Putative secreted protein n=1 Tax=Anopheles darlingi TaxID=43151 RepID=A0A2M4D5I9_ANODA